MKPSYSCKCLKCNKIFSLTPHDLDEKPEDRLNEEQIKKLKKDGCLKCGSKNCEWEQPDYIEGERIIWHTITDQCPKCSKIRTIDIPNWEEVKNTKGFPKTKQEAIKAMNGNNGLCDCNDIERERAKMDLTENLREWLVEEL
jgi:hypothetical protein